MHMETLINLHIPTHSMATKTITVTEEAYRTLAGMKQKNESFSKTILRIGKRQKPLTEFFGILSKDKGDLYETIRQSRKENACFTEKKEKLILKRLKEKK